MSGLAEKRVYLAGPITGLSYQDSRHGWRADFQIVLDQLGGCEHIKLCSPMRAKDHLSELTKISGKGDAYDNFMSSGRGVVCRDRNDVKTADAVVFNFLGADKASVGSCIEIGWADAWQKPTVLVMEDNGLAVDDGNIMVPNPHDHLMVDEICGYRVCDLTQAAFAVKWLLTSGL